MYGYAMNKEDFQSRLAKVEGQVRGLQRMIDEDKYCIDILTQLNATTARSKAIGVGLLDSHVRHCVRESIERGQGDAEIELLVAAVARFVGRVSKPDRPAPCTTTRRSPHMIENASFVVPTISCGHCKGAIEGAAGAARRGRRGGRRHRGASA